jgi:hypothetical protein
MKEHQTSDQFYATSRAYKLCAAYVRRQQAFALESGFGLEPPAWNLIIRHVIAIDPQHVWGDPTTPAYRRGLANAARELRRVKRG